MKKHDPLDGREIYLEYKPFGNLMKVTAVDAKTLIEASISGPLKAGEHILQANALKRLEYVLRKRGYIA